MKSFRGLRRALSCLALGLAVHGGSGAADGVDAPLALRLSSEAEVRPGVVGGQRTSAPMVHLDAAPLALRATAGLSAAPAPSAILPSPAAAPADRARSSDADRSAWPTTVLGAAAVLLLLACLLVLLGWRAARARRHASANSTRADGALQGFDRRAPGGGEFDREHRDAPAEPPDRFGAGSAPHRIGAARIEALHRVLQEADGLLRRERPRQAVDLLRHHLRIDPDASPAVWLALAQALRQAGQREDHAAVRSRLQARFGIALAEFDAEPTEPGSLEACGDLVDQVCASWPSRQGLALIEELVFRRPEPDLARSLHLQAYRDLLLLHRLGRDVLAGQAAGDRPHAASQPAAAHAAEPAGWLHWVLPALLGLFAAEVLVSGRDLTRHFSELEAAVEGLAGAARHPALAWLQRGMSLLLLLASFERILRHLQHRRPAPSPMLLGSLILYWLASVAAAGLFGANPRVSHEYAYALVLGTAMAWSGPLQRDLILLTLRDALFVFLLASFLLVPALPNLTMDWSYAQGLLPGVPRFGGLALHPVGMGVLAYLALMCLWVCPFEHPRLQRAAWVLGLAALFLAQSKTAWLAFTLGAFCLLLVRSVPEALARTGDPRHRPFGVALCTAVITFVGVSLFALLVADLPGRITDYLDSSQGAQLMSLTGRDRIWVVALEEWRHSPLFGYGLTIWDEAHRQEIGMPFATHAHNQFMDTLARSGVIGAGALVLYALVLTVLAFRYAHATGGLSLAIWSGLALLSVSEVPLLLAGLDTGLLLHMLLVVSIAAAAAGDQAHAAGAPLPGPALDGRGVLRTSGT